jgi:hypothetical protein
MLEIESCFHSLEDGRSLTRTESLPSELLKPNYFMVHGIDEV